MEALVLAHWVQCHRRWIFGDLVWISALFIEKLILMMPLTNIFNCLVSKYQSGYFGKASATKVDEFRFLSRWCWSHLVVVLLLFNQYTVTDILRGNWFLCFDFLLFVQHNRRFWEIISTFGKTFEASVIGISPVLTNNFLRCQWHFAQWHTDQKKIWFCKQIWFILVCDIRYTYVSS